MIRPHPVSFPLRSWAARLQARWFLWRHRKPLFTQFIEASPALFAAYLGGQVMAFLIRSYVIGPHAWW